MPLFSVHELGFIRVIVRTTRAKRISNPICERQSVMKYLVTIDKSDQLQN
jgi:hypothetical protein